MDITLLEWAERKDFKEASQLYVCEIVKSVIDQIAANSETDWDAAQVWMFDDTESHTETILIHWFVSKNLLNGWEWTAKIWAYHAGRWGTL